MLRRRAKGRAAPWPRFLLQRVRASASMLGPERRRVVTEHRAPGAGDRPRTLQPRVGVRLAVELAEQRRVGVGQVAELGDVLGQLLRPDLIGLEASFRCCSTAH